MKRFFTILLSAAILVSATVLMSCDDEGSSSSGGDNYYTGGGNNTTSGGTDTGSGTNSSGGNISDTSSGSSSSDGSSSESGNSNTTTTKLSAPTGVIAIAASSSSVKLSWNFVSGATKYKVYNATYSSSTYASFVCSTTSTSTTVTGLKANTKYYFWVKADNGITTSDYSLSDYATTWATSSSGSSGTTTTKLSAPTGVTATAASSSSIQLSWNSVSGATEYQVYCSEYSYSSSASLLGSRTLTSITITGLEANTKYYFWVKATNSTTTSDYSSYAYATTKAATATWTPPTTYQELTNLGAENAITRNVYAGNVYWFRLYAPQSSSSQYTYTISFFDKDASNSFSSDVVATYYNQNGIIYASNVDNGTFGKSCSYLASQYLYVKVECKQSGTFAIYAERKKS